MKIKVKANEDKVQMKEHDFFNDKQNFFLTLIVNELLPLSDLD
jgi:hypothetical protein